MSDDIRAETEKQQAVDAFNRLDRLTNNADFIWYLENVIKPLVDEERGNALDVGTSKDARDTAAQRLDLGTKILGEAASKRIFWANKGDLTI